MFKLLENTVQIKKKKKKKIDIFTYSREEYR